MISARSASSVFEYIPATVEYAATWDASATSGNALPAPDARIGTSLITMYASARTVKLRDTWSAGEVVIFDVIPFQRWYPM